MKKHLPAIVLGVAVFAISLIFQKYTLMHEGMWSLFLLTPDYFRESMTLPLPLTRVASDFLVQFFDIAAVGPVITAMLVVCIYLVGGSMLLACAGWVFTACSSSPQPLLLALLIAVLLRIVLKAVRVKLDGRARIARYALVAAAAIAIILIPKVRKTEILSSLELNARQAGWEKVLDKATPSRCLEDDSLRPYAALALASEGELVKSLGLYHFNKAQDLDMEGVLSREGYYFSSLMYEALACPNEAVHRIFQAGCHCDHGCSFMVLYQLIRYNIERGDYTMVRKYAGILSRSPRHRRLARMTLATYGNLPDECGQINASPITNNPIFNIPMLWQQGLQNDFSSELFQAYMSLSR